jgi:hypothetical protein
VLSRGGKDMRRRDFIRIVGGLAAVWPLVARGEQARFVRIGAPYIGIADADSFKKELREGLRELGYVEGKTSHSSSAPLKESWINFLGSPPSSSG